MDRDLSVGRVSTIRFLLFAYAFVNSILYSVLLPLWEGFDEPFHFAYVQDLANGNGLPDPRTARLSGEVGESLLLAPASHIVKMNLPQVTTYSDYFSSSASRRVETRHKLDEISSDLRWRPSDFMNYEAHHPPLAYTLLALPERVLADISLPLRVSILRIIAAIAGSMLLLIGADRLFTQLAIRDPYKFVALFCLLSCQMIWATVAHIANDWLAVPIAVWMLVALNQFNVNPGYRTVIAATAFLAAGLLTKAYFLAFVPLLIGVVALRRRWRELTIALLILGALAGPWYARNMIRYGVITGMQESRAGINLASVFHSSSALDWPSLILSNIRISLWNGNNTFSSFSANTVNLIICTVLVGLVLWTISRHSSIEWTTLSYCVLFVLALGYSAVVTYLYARGMSGPSPWYSQVLVAPLFGLALLGVSRWGNIGKLIACLLTLEFGYLLIATYVVKLVPLYGGHAERTSLAGIAALYSQRLAMLAENLNTASLAPATLIFSLTGVVVLLAILLQAVLILRLFREKLPSRDCKGAVSNGR